MEADLAGRITASIVCPGLIYGVGSGPDKIISSLIPDSVRRGIRFGRVPVGGKGTNVWSDVSLHEGSHMWTRRYFMSEYDLLIKTRFTSRTSPS